RRHLDDRAARRHQPIEALALRQLPDRPRVLAAGADGRNRREMRAHRLEVDGGIERDEPLLVELDLRDQQIELRARDDHARVHELGALDLRYDAHYRVVIRDEIAHGSPPRETLAAIPV